MAFDTTDILIAEVTGDGVDEFVTAVDGILDEAALALGRPFVSERVHIRASAPDGTMLGGLVGARLQGWLYVKLLGVSEHARGRGVGAKLLAAAEDMARNDRLAGVYLDTFEFQAPRFYLREGYAEIGRLPKTGQAPQRIWYAKTFDDSGSDT
ncbi:GNAT family N-acetyltransferase [Ciceribacter sp. L1K22]|uniref:GNAT family N-acetyltransferase n=1 Tax=Ciceribacter sp. L1K22 TaxID=2820275 RepID=UPI001ABE4C52|nr:GNAT family N-acetyltransferase [Ciceribacter sp. L1K22]MBO3760557.1 GNAT family N-acetyltransferase [Ciceribacter sp. L1K22]